MWVSTTPASLLVDRARSVFRKKVAMGADQSTAAESGSADAVQAQTESKTGLPVEIHVTQKLEVATQTDPIEDAGYDMTVPRRKRRLFGVVTVVGDSARDIAVPSTEEAQHERCCAPLSSVVHRAVRCACRCAWLSKM